MPSIEKTIALVGELTGKTFPKVDFVKRVEELHPRIAELIKKSVADDATFEMAGEVVANYNRAILQIKRAGEIIGSGVATVMFGDYLSKPTFESDLILPQGIRLRGIKLMNEQFKLVQAGGDEDGLKEIFNLSSGDKVFTTDLNRDVNSATQVNKDKNEFVIDRLFYNKNGDQIQEIVLEIKDHNLEWNKLVKNGRIYCYSKISENPEKARGAISLMDDSNQISSVLRWQKSNRIDLLVTPYNGGDDYFVINMDEAFNVIGMENHSNCKFLTSLLENKDLLSALENKTKIPDSFIQENELIELFEMHKQLPKTLYEYDSLRRNFQKSEISK